MSHTRFSYCFVCHTWTSVVQKGGSTAQSRIGISQSSPDDIGELIWRRGLAQSLTNTMMRWSDQSSASSIHIYICIYYRWWHAKGAVIHWTHCGNCCVGECRIPHAHRWKIEFLIQLLWIGKDKWRRWCRVSIAHYSRGQEPCYGGVLHAAQAERHAKPLTAAMFARTPDCHHPRFPRWLLPVMLKRLEMRWHSKQANGKN